MKIKVASKMIAVPILSLIVGYATAVPTPLPTLSPTLSPTFSPTLVPTLVPSASSAPSPFCDDGMNVEVKILTDRYPEETSWELRHNDCEHEVVMSGGPYDEDETWFRAEECLPLGNYIFTIYDSVGDGLSTYGGKYEVNVDGVTTISGGGEREFWFETNHLWNKCVSRPPPPYTHNHVFFFYCISLLVVRILMRARVHSSLLHNQD